MFICNECGEIFSDHKIIKEPRPYGMGVAYEEFGVCPYCNSDDCDEAEKCERCGEYVAELHDDLCDICHEDMYG